MRRPCGPGRQHGVSEHPAVVIPRCGPASPFKGHLSTKSNAFCIDSSQSLTNQYLIRDHLMFHYNKILSAKAAVDCSVPRSRLTSVKLADQQRREKMKKKLARCEKEMSEGKNASRSSSRESGRLLSSSLGKDLGANAVSWSYTAKQFEYTQYESSFLHHIVSSLEAEDHDHLFPCAQRAQYLSRTRSPPGEHGLVHSSPVKYARKDSRNTSNASNSSSSVSISRPLRKQSGISCSCSTDSFVGVSHSQRHQEANSKTYSGDLLDRHSDFFTDSRKPFTPRTLISDAKSFLSQYRYYTPARRKRKNRRKQQVDAETQTDVISFPCADKASDRKAMTEHQKTTAKAEDKRHTVDKPERTTAALQYSFPRATPMYSEQPSARREIQSEEEELLYLTFIEDVTNEILKLGLFSNRVLEQLFECHIQENKHHLDENKMRHLLGVLKVDLGCSPGRSTEEIHASQEAFHSDLETFNTMQQLKFTRKRWRQRKTIKSEEFFRAMDLLSKEPNKGKSPVCFENSKERQSKDDFLVDVAEMMTAGTDSHSSAKSEEGPDTSPTFDATLNSISCDSDLETTKDLDDLEESFAEALQLSPGYPE
ncbi:spermatogenesis-associated protein 7 isoform X2 [Struthio camelus]|uniref:spermatogenesis-associated protein 7 isoform X2 n=1 Tax=Struthio camelus TaxID=8801 RepID=UPI003604170F